MKRLFPLLLLCLFFSTTSKAGLRPSYKNPKLWHKGTVVFHSGIMIECDLQFTRKVAEGLLQVLQGDQVMILTVKDVASFTYFDEKKKKVRKFFTISLRPDLSTRQHEIFIEYLYGNKQLSILNYRTLGFVTDSFQFNPLRKKTVVNQRYLLDNESGKVLPMSKENALKLMENRKREVLSFIQAQGLQLKTVDEFISLLDYHQSLL